MASTVTRSTPSLLIPKLGVEFAEWTIPAQKERLTKTILKVIGDKKGQPGIPAVLVDIIVDFQKVAPSNFKCKIEARHWNYFIGRVAEGPPLPAEIEALAATSCPEEATLKGSSKKTPKTIGETHIAVQLPSMVNEEDLTFENFGRLIQRYFPQNTGGPREILGVGKYNQPPGYHTISKTVIEALGRQPIGQARWILMRNDLRLGIKGIPYSEHQEHIRDCLPDYRIPTAFEATLASVMIYLTTGERLFSRKIFKDNYTFTSDQVKGFRVYVGGFGKEGIQIGEHVSADRSGAVLLRPVIRLLED